MKLEERGTVERLESLFHCGYSSPRWQVAVFFGGLSIKKDEEVLKKNCPHIVVGTPGRILALARNKSLNLKHIKHFILDECDKMLEQLGEWQCWDWAFGTKCCSVDTGALLCRTTLHLPPSRGLWLPWLALIVLFKQLSCSGRRVFCPSVLCWVLSLRGGTWLAVASIISPFPLQIPLLGVLGEVPNSPEQEMVSPLTSSHSICHENF